MKFDSVYFRSDVAICGMYKKQLVAGDNFDLSSDGNWLWVEILSGANKGKIVGVPREMIMNVTPADPDDVRRRRDGAQAATTKKAKEAA